MPGDLAPVSGLGSAPSGLGSVLGFAAMFGFAFIPGGLAAIDGLASVGFASVFADEDGVPSPGFAIVLPAGAFLSRGVGMFALGATVPAPFGFDPGSTVAGFSSLAATTPLPVNSPGLEVAATAGLPWFSEARRLLSELAVRSCWNCAGAAATCCSCAAASSSRVGRAVVPPLPPLKLTLEAPGATMTVFS